MGRKTRWIGALALSLTVALASSTLLAASSGADVVTPEGAENARVLTVVISELGAKDKKETVLRVALTERGDGSIESHGESGDFELKAHKSDDDGKSALVALRLQHNKRRAGKMEATTVRAHRELVIGKPALMSVVQQGKTRLRVVATLH